MEPKYMSAEDLYLEEILEAQRMTPEERLLEGPRLFDRACIFMLAGIRNENPGISEDEARRILDDQLDTLERLEHTR
jgi:hypothetical protein